MQLQFLPLLYRRKGEGLLVSALPSEAYLEFLSSRGFSTDHIYLQTLPLDADLELWGASRAVSLWSHGRTQEPSWELVRKIHSKLFSFSLSEALPHSQLLEREEEKEEWLLSFPGPKVFKKAFGAAGSGHLKSNTTLNKTLFPLIAEPWVTRIFDFSTQWKIGKEIEYIGATVLENSPHGVYLGTLAGDEGILFREHAHALEEHLECVRPIVKKIALLGFFGHLGIDAFVYEWEGKRRLRAVTEINARKTMGWTALTIQRRHYPKKVLKMRYEKTALPGFLPQELGKIRFQRQLLLECL
jgi:hypothetical protein